MASAMRMVRKKEGSGGQAGGNPDPDLRTSPRRVIGDVGAEPSIDPGDTEGVNPSRTYARPPTGGTVRWTWERGGPRRQVLLPDEASRKRPKRFAATTEI